MNPKEFGWSDDQQVTVTNPTKDKFEFMVHSKAYAVGAGQTANMPGYIAWVYVYGLAHKMAQEDGQDQQWIDEGFRKKYYDKVVVGAEDVVKVTEPEPQVETFGAAEDEPEEDAEPANQQIAPMEAKKLNRGRATATK